MNVSTPVTLFQEHGILPFVGRRRELDRLRSIIEQTAPLPVLRTLLVTGQAGSGKSRLLQELRINLPSSYVALEVSFHRGAPGDVLTHLAGALTLFAATRPLLYGQDVSPTLPGISSALRRLSRLRPTLLLFDNLDILAPEALHQLTHLLKMLADEPLVVLCLARPGRPYPRNVLERFLVEELLLPPWDRGDVAELWLRLFGTPPQEDIVQMLLELTSGNPLAMRAALRSALHNRAIDYNPATRRREPTISMPALRSLLSYSVDFIAEELTHPLDSDALEAAERLATLGEVFGHETATMFLEGKEKECLQTLLERNIIVPVTTPAPVVCGEMGTSALCFSHTLLHRSLLRARRFNPDRFLSALAEGAAVYSTLPFRILTGCIEDVAPGNKLIEHAVERILKDVENIPVTGGHETIGAMLTAAEQLLRRYRAEGSDPILRELHLRLLQRRLQLSDKLSPDDILTYIDEYDRLTEHPADRTTALHRFGALSARFRLSGPGSRQVAQSTGIEWMDLLKRFPELAVTREYFQALSNAVFTNLTMILNEVSLPERVAEETDELFRGTWFTGPPTAMEGVITPFLLAHFSVQDGNRYKLSMERLWSPFYADTTLQRATLDLIISSPVTRRSSPQEAEAGFRMVQRMAELAPEDLVLSMKPVAALLGMGKLEPAGEMIRKRLPTIHLLDSPAAAEQWELFDQLIATAFGRDFTVPADRFTGAFGQTPTRAWLPAGRIFLLIAVLTGNETRAIRFLEGLDPTGREFMERVPLTRALMFLHSSTTPDRDVPADDRHFPRLFPLLRLLASDKEKVDDVLLLERASAALALPIVIIQHLVVVLMAIRLLEHRRHQRKNQEVLDKLQPRIIDALVTVLAWMEERSLFAYMNEVLRRHGETLPEPTRKEWEKRTAGVKRSYLERHRQPEFDRIGVSLIGKITLRHRDGSRQPVRGDRIRTLLGLMAANAMLQHPLSYEEFCRIASGVDNDLPYAKHMSGNTVSRLRGLLGHEAVCTDQLPPRLHPELTTIDLVEAHLHVESALRMLNRKHLFQAYAAIMKALEIVGDDVVFPTLYHPFFEAAREDFDGRLRSTILSITTALMEEQDREHAALLIRRALQRMPEDEALKAGMARIAAEAEAVPDGSQHRRLIRMAS